MFNRIPSSLIVGCIVMFVPGMTSAQLNNVQWSESLSLDAVPVENLAQVGVDSAAPEPLSGALNGAGYSIQGSVTFANGGPNATSHVDGSYQNGLAFLGGSAYCRIDFEFRVQQTSNPPVSVSTVPVNVSVQGTAGVTGTGNLFATAWSSVNIATGSGPLGDWMVRVDNSSGDASDNFNESPQYMIAPGTLVFGDKTASASISAEILSPNSSASATAWVDPIFEIADLPIPGGGGATYRDHFTIEFADGYWATPVEETTWEEVKRLYR